MAKGDHSRMQNAVNYQGGLAQNHLDNFRTNMTRQNQGLENRFNVAADRGNSDYDSLMGMGSGYMNNVVNGPMQNFGAYGGYQNFAQTGGYSPEDIAAIRARSVAPTRAIYANANSAVDRSKALAGGYSPNYAAAKAKMARELSYTLGDQAMNTEAMLADAIHSGKLAGLGGMTNIDSALLNAQNQRLGIGANMFGQMGQLYGTAPGMAQLYGNQMLDSSKIGMGTEGLQGDIMRNILGAQNNVSNTKGNWQSAMDNVGGGIDNATKIGKIFSGF